MDPTNFTENGAKGKILPMSKILSIETSSESASAALLLDQQLFARQTQGVATHSGSVLPMVQSLLQEAGMRLPECDAIAFGSGPGSFTGVRTACGVAQGLAFGLDLPVIPIVTLAALAEACRQETGAEQVVTAMDARMGEVYWAQYRFDACSRNWITIVEPALSAPGLVCPTMVDGLALVGNGLAAYLDQFNLPKTLLMSAQPSIPSADAIARLAQIEFAANRLCKAQDAQPLYLRNKIAQTIEERLKK